MRLADLDSTWVYTYAWHDTTVAGLGWIMYSSRYGRYYEDNWGNIVHYYTFNK